MLTFLAFLFAIALLVFVHEFGHYWVARKCGVGVLTFSIGFGKPIYQWQRGETRWQIAMIPLGGFVRMMDEREAAVASESQTRAFNRQHPLKKMAVVVAGPVANLLFAILAFSLCYMLGVQSLKPQVLTVQPGSLAQLAGIQAGDRIVALNNQKIESWDQFQLMMFDVAGNKQVVLKLKNQEGLNKQVNLPIGKLSAEQYDQHLLDRLGLSPFASLRSIAYLQPEGAGLAAGLQVNDEIVAINQHPVKDWSTVQQLVMEYGKSALVITVKRQNELLTIVAKPRLESVDGVVLPRLGMAPQSDIVRNQQQVIQVKLEPLDAFGHGLDKTYQMSLMTLSMFGKMIGGILSPRQVSGPIGIAQYAGQSAAMGVIAYLQFLALISISLGVLNLLPIPILDGGHLLYHSYELLTGREPSLFLTEWLQKLGIILLLMLMALALFNDTSRLLG
ncbi:RIP metalloprotease RseP [Chitinibacter sp. S2-10]|uniref:RIP metalloprotease RseP n=1 Tax=Chitinibacter sp. S2-10 TaxID=3373597 RepID=UPI0039777B81